MKKSLNFSMLVIALMWSCSPKSEGKTENVISKDTATVITPEKNDDSAEVGTEQNTDLPINNEEQLAAELQEDLKNLSAESIAEKWLTTYDRLPEKYKNTVVTSNGSFPLDYGNFDALNRGFSWGCDQNEKLFTVWEILSEKTAQKSKTDAYRSGIVTQYFRNQILQCQ